MIGDPEDFTSKTILLMTTLLRLMRHLGNGSTPEEKFSFVDEHGTKHAARPGD